MDLVDLKRAAGERAAELVESGMVVGMGHGSTAIFALRAIARKLESRELSDVRGVPCSLKVERDAAELGIPMVSLAEVPVVDLTIDGADEVDPELNLIKGGGGALLREKVVAQASRREIIVVDETKLSDALGTRFKLPVEVLEFGREPEVRFLEGMGATVSSRHSADGSQFLSDQGNPILDCDFGPISDCAGLAAALSGRAGILGHGLFLGLATEVIVAGKGGIRRLNREV